VTDFYQILSTYSLTIHYHLTQFYSNELLIHVQLLTGEINPY